MEKGKITSSIYYRWFAIFCLVVVGFISLGILYYHYEADLIRNDKYEDISTIAKLKVNSIDEWRRYRLADVKRASIGRLVKRDMVRLFQDPTNPSTRASLQIQLNINKKDTVYADTLFLDTKGNILLSDNPNPAPVDQTTMKAIEVALKDRKGVLSDFFRDPEGIIYIDAVAPILDNSGQPIAITVLRSKAADFLYPLIQSWPAPSKTAETLLVCREGDSALFLNELRHRSNTALTLRFPLTDTYLPAVQAVLGKYGKFFGRDYRGVDVLAVTQPVPDSSWSVVAKVDADEVLAEVKYRAWTVSIIIFLLILISAGLIMNIYRNRREVERRKAEKTLLESEEKFRTIFDRASDGILIADAINKKFLQGNTAICSMLGYTKEEIERLTINDIHPPNDISHVLDEFKKQAIGEKVLAERLPVLKKDGSIFYADISSSSATIGGINCLVGIFHDITERKQAEEILQANRAQLSNALEIAHLGHWEYDVADDLFTFNDQFYKIFRTTVEQVGGYTMHSAEYAHRFVHPDDINIVGEETRKAIETTDPHFNRQIEHRMLYADGMVGYITVRFFIVKDSHGRTVKTYGVNQDITERKRAEEDLKQAEERYRSIFENTQEGIFRATPDGKLLMANQAMAKMFGYESPEEMMAGITDIARQHYVNPEDRRKLKETIEEHGFIKGYEAQNYRKDGSIIWISLTMHAVRDEKRQIIFYDGIIEDITNRKESTERMRKALGATVQAMAVTVETRDPYTAGHQHRVADLARSIAMEMNLSTDQIDGIRMAAIIHDLGKISVPAEILSKPTKLTNIEFSLIKTHSQSGYDILKDIDFPWPVARTILEHHERMNGSGYPNGLTGDNILLESRILSVADVVEAMASHRPYRPGLGLDAALEEIEKNRGMLYDHAVADACLRLFREKGYQLQ